MAIMVACVLIHVGLALAGEVPAFAASVRGGLVPLMLQHDALRAEYGNLGWMTLISSQFLHADFSHLAINMLMLLLVGRPVEWLAGPWRFALLYLASGVAGGLLQVASNPMSYDPIIGASSGISGLFGAYALTFSRERVRDRRCLGVQVSGRLLRMIWIFAAWVFLQLLIGLGLGMGGRNVAIWAHIGGFLAGMMLVGPLVHGRIVRRPDAP